MTHVVAAFQILYSDDSISSRVHFDECLLNYVQSTARHGRLHTKNGAIQLTNLHCLLHNLVSTSTLKKFRSNVVKFVAKCSVLLTAVILSQG